MEKRFKVGDQEYVVIQPRGKMIREAEQMFLREVNHAIKNGCYMARQVQEMARNSGILTDEIQKEHEDLVVKIEELEAKLKDQDTENKKEIAQELFESRNRLFDIRMPLISLENYSAEGQAKDAKNDYLLSRCVYTLPDKKPYFSSIDDYYNKLDDEVTGIASIKFSQIINGYSDDEEMFTFPSHDQRGS